MFWPAVFIIVGIIYITTKRRGWGAATSKGVTGDDYVDYVNVFSGGERQIISQNFQEAKYLLYSGGSSSISQKQGLHPECRYLK
jgi:hypothetical protein